ncbi:MAG: Gfo/Idh/MocA family oxidoreductase [Crocinitomicaceae bacterium]|jgi:predicted dehydrogenase|nr:Gfo/Idh/MocA family oxidoreductase [Crocinitomicaceae bacterium]
MLKIGVLGAGHLGKIHIRLLLELNDLFEFVGFYDPNDDNARHAEQEFGIKRFETIDELIDQVDALDIVTPTLSHFDCASKAIKAFKHVFIEKPITETVQEAKNLISLSTEAGVKVQVGHVERFNPAFQEARPYLENPMFIETHRLAQFNPRGTDVPVVLDLMIHDIDVILSVVKSNVKNISASGVSVVSDTPDITNARIEFENGCVANLTASRISMKNMRKSRFFQKDAYISVDFLTKETEIVRMKDIEGEPDPFDVVFDPGNGKPVKKVYFDKPKIGELNAIKEELRSFHQAIVNDEEPIVNIHDGFYALHVAQQILDKMDSKTVLS